MITDDSPDDSVREITSLFSNLPIRYYKNATSLGTPGNWNKAISYAQGRWIKLIHDDDWLSDQNGLQTYVEAAETHPEIEFFFSAYNNIDEGSGISNPVYLTEFRKSYLKNPHRLLANNVVGPPSVVLYKKDDTVTYDEQLKWLVDIDFYIHYLKGKEFYYINQPIVNIGINNEQVTKSSFRVRQVEIPEHFHVLNKIGYASLKDVVVYDALWRLFRNLEIKSESDIEQAGFIEQVPPVIAKMIAHQRKLPRRLLQIGPVSKTAMLFSYLSRGRRMAQ